MQTNIIKKRRKHFSNGRPFSVGSAVDQRCGWTRPHCRQHTAEDEHLEAQVDSSLRSLRGLQHLTQRRWELERGIFEEGCLINKSIARYFIKAKIRNTQEARCIWRRSKMRVGELKTIWLRVLQSKPFIDQLLPSDHPLTILLSKFYHPALKPLPHCAIRLTAGQIHTLKWIGSSGWTH